VSVFTLGHFFESWIQLKNLGLLFLSPYLTWLQCQTCPEMPWNAPDTLGHALKCPVSLISYFTLLWYAYKTTILKITIIKSCSNVYSDIRFRLSAKNCSIFMYNMLKSDQRWPIYIYPNIPSGYHWWFALYVSVSGGHSIPFCELDFSQPSLARS